MSRRSSELISGAAASKPKKTIGKIKVQGIYGFIIGGIQKISLRFFFHNHICSMKLLSCVVRKVKMSLDTPSGCVFPQMPKVDLETFHSHVSNVKTKLALKWEALQRVQAARHVPKNGSLSSKSLAYVHVGAQYMKEIGIILKSGLPSSQTTESQIVQGILF